MEKQVKKLENGSTLGTGYASKEEFLSDIGKAEGDGGMCIALAVKDEQEARDLVDALHAIYDTDPELAIKLAKLLNDVSMAIVNGQQAKDEADATVAAARTVH